MQSERNQMKFKCEITLTRNESKSVNMEVESLTDGGAIDKINKSLADTFRDCDILISVKEVTP